MKADPRKGRAGRKSKWTSHVEPHLERIKYWRRMGLLEKEICNKLDVSEHTFCKFKRIYPQLLHALKESKEEADQEVVNALFKRACGFEYTETEIIGTPDETGKKMAKIERVITHKRYEPPHSTAQIFYLKNRCPLAWQDVQDFRHQGKIDSSSTHQVSPEMLQQFHSLLSLEIQKRLSAKDVSVDGNSDGNGNGSKNRIATLVKIP